MSKHDAYVQKAQAIIDGYVAKLDGLKAEAKLEVADRRIELHEQIEQVQKKIDAGKADLVDLAGTAEEKWDEVKERFESLTGDISASLKKFLN